MSTAAPAPEMTGAVALAVDNYRRLRLAERRVERADLDLKRSLYRLLGDDDTETRMAEYAAATAEIDALFAQQEEKARA